MEKYIIVYRIQDSGDGVARDVFTPVVSGLAIEVNIDNYLFLGSMGHEWKEGYSFMRTDSQEVFEEHAHLILRREQWWEACGMVTARDRGITLPNVHAVLRGVPEASVVADLIKELARVAGELEWHALDDDPDRSVQAQHVTSVVAKSKEMLETIACAEGLMFDYETFDPTQGGGGWCVQFKLSPCLQFDTEMEMLEAQRILETQFKPTA